MSRLLDPGALASFREESLRARHAWPVRVTLSSGTCGEASGSLSVLRALQDDLQKHGLADEVHVRVTGCQGFCQQEPLLIVEPLDVLYCRVTAEDVAEIVSESVVGGRVVERLCFADDVSGRTTRTPADLPFFAKQDRELIGRNRLIDPRDIGDYIASGGYSALAHVLTSMDPDAVIEEIEASGLRGRGGGGYPTARKWEQCRRAPGEERYVICNADEGDPGAYMDRGLLEGNPHSILEGMLIGAYAVGSRKGYVYVRNEYPLAVMHTRRAIEQARDLGLLGENILGTDFSFDVKVARGGGAFVCGESTALMASLEGEVGEPRAKDVHTVERGYLEQPTVLNNVETWANVPRIITNGSAWFAAKGTDKSKGTKIFALTGHVKNTGLVEVEMGTTLREIIFDIGGGAQDGKAIKAVQTGGPSGGCLPVSRFDLPVDYEALAAAGSMMGSGGMVVMDESACMVDVARYFLEFLSRGVLRQVRALPARDQPDARDPHRCRRGPGTYGAARHSQRARLDHGGGLAVRVGQDRAEPGPIHLAVLPGRIRSTHQRSPLPGRRVPGVTAVLHRPGAVHTVRLVRRRLPARRDHRGRRLPDRPGVVRTVRHLRGRLPC